MIRLGDGTEESRRRILIALEEIWSYTGELFQTADFEHTEISGVNIAALQTTWQKECEAVFSEAGLPMPADRWMQSGGKQGIHTEYMGYILAEMQSVARAHPNATW